MSQSPAEAASPPARVGLWPWFMWGLGALFYCYGFFQRVAPSVMVEDLMSDFAVSAAVLGNLSAFYFYAYASIQLPVGLLLDRFGPRRILTVATALCGAGSLVFAMAQTLEPAYIGRLMIGAGAGFTWVGALKIASDWLPPKRFALVSGLTLGLGMAGAIGGQAPLAALVAIFGWRGTLMAAAAAAIVLALLIALVVRDKARPQAHPGQAQMSVMQGLLRVVATPQTWFVSVYGAALTAPMLAFAGLWGVPYMMQAYGLERPAAAFCTSLLLIGWGIGAPLSGWFSDFIRRRKVPMLLGSTTALISFSLLVYMPGLPLFGAYVLLLVNGIASGSMVVCFATAREHNSPRAAGATLGFANMSVMSTGAIFQPLIGWLMDKNWDGTIVAGARIYDLAAYHAAFLSLVACGVAGVIAALLVRETHCENQVGE